MYSHQRRYFRWWGILCRGKYSLGARADASKSNFSIIFLSLYQEDLVEREPRRNLCDARELGFPYILFQDSSWRIIFSRAQHSMNGSGRMTNYCAWKSAREWVGRAEPSSASLIWGAWLSAKNNYRERWYYPRTLFASQRFFQAFHFCGYIVKCKTICILTRGT